MANLSKSRTLFGFTSPRTIEKIIPEIEILCGSFEGKEWSGNEDLQASFFQKLFDSEYYDGETFPSDPALAARDRITRAPKALGFVDLTPVIKLTEAGQMLLSRKRIDETFSRQLLKFQLPSPYHTASKEIEFGVKPYLELLRLIYDLGSLSKTEIALFFLQLIHYKGYDKIVKKILSFREKAKTYKGSRKLYVSECFHAEILHLFKDEINLKKFKTRESKEATLNYFVRTKQANMKDHADAFVRYIRSTELVTFQQGSFRLVVSPQRKEEVEFILNTIDRNPKSFTSEDEFKEYMFSPYETHLLSDNREALIRKLENMGLKFTEKQDIEVLKDILDNAKIKLKEKNIAEKKSELKDYQLLPEILEVFDRIKKRDVPDAPLFLEWNIWRAFVMLNYANRIDTNLIMDIDGMPLNTAPGNKADMEIEFDDFGIIGEVTMSSGATQFKMEGDSVPRHYGDFKERINKDAYCLFIAPRVDDGTIAFFFNLNKGYTKRYGGATRIIPLTLDKFIEFVNIGILNKFSNPNKLKKWLEEKWKINQTVVDEVTWNCQVENSLPNWA